MFLKINTQNVRGALSISATGAILQQRHLTSPTHNPLSLPLAIAAQKMRNTPVRQFRHTGVVKAKLESTSAHLAEERQALRQSAQEFLEVRQQIAERDEQIEDARAEINDLLAEIRDALAQKQEAKDGAAAAAEGMPDDGIARLVEERLAALRELLPQ
jgi:DNA repair exonuclease SbcCD ATPase subunit